MKKQILLVIMMAALGYCSFAGTVTQQKAQAIALNFFTLNYPDVAAHNPLTATLKYTQTETDNTVDFYVFDMSPAKGFVIVAADDIIIPILAYSNESNFNPDFGRVGVHSWVRKTAKNIHHAVQQHVVASEGITKQWTAYAQGTMPDNMKSTSVSPLCATTWDQESTGNPPPYFYNLFCPYDTADGQRALTGCVATAQAQIMKYWNYPAKGTGSFTYVDDTVNGYSNNYGTLSSDFAAHTYQWPLMPVICMGNETGAQDSAVDLLMYDCGVSVGMDYGDDNQNGSGAEGLLAIELQQYGDSLCTQYALVNYFLYDPDTIKGVIMSDYTDSAWIALMEHDLNLGRPIFYEGSDSTQGGHAWVCDGYDATGKLHMNWGWSGTSDGYFAVNNLTTPGFNPVDTDAALIGILPKHTVSGIINTNDAISFGMYPNPAASQVTVRFDNMNSPGTINLINILGQTVLAKNITDTQTVVDLSALANGIYLMQLKQGEKFAVKQLVVAK